MSNKKPKNQKKNKDYIKQRYVLFSVVITVIAVMVVARLVSTTIVYADEWKAKAEKTLGDTIISAPERGMILADDGSVIAGNVTLYKAKIDWRADALTTKLVQSEFYKDLPALCDSLAVFPGGRSADEWRRELLREFEAKSNRNYHLTHKFLTKGERTRIEHYPFFDEGRNSSGLVFTSHVRRCHPNGDIAARTIGTALPDDRAIARSGNLQQTFFDGRTGLEAGYDSVLAGVEGEMFAVQSLRNTLLWEHKPAQPGRDIMTTINLDMQEILDQELRAVCVRESALWCTAVLMEVATGDIKAISSVQRIDSADASKGYSGRIFNHAFLAQELGSVMKPISMMVAVEDGKVDFNRQYKTGKNWFYPNATQKITDDIATEWKWAREIIAHSSNIGIATIIKEGYGHNPREFRRRLRQVGVVDSVRLKIGGVDVLYPYMAAYPTEGDPNVQITRMSYGYSVAVAPINILAIYNAIANDGKYMRPRLVKQIMHDGIVDTVFPPELVRQICSPRTADTIRSMMRGVITNPRGSGRRLRNRATPDGPDTVAIAGKTGTARIWDDATKSYLRSGSRLTFCGFFPYENPKYTCIAVFERPIHGGAANSSGKVVKNIALKMYGRGMLTDDHLSGVDGGTQARGVLYALYDGSSNARDFVSLATLQKMAQQRRPQPQQQGVPDVVGLGVRQATEVLEKAGLRVQFTGWGCVVKQSLPPGSRYKPGAVITLKLHE